MTAPNRRQFLHDALVLAAGVAFAGVAAGCSHSDGAARAAPRSTTTSTPNAPRPGIAQDAVAHEAFLTGFPLVTTVRTMQTFAQLFGVNRLNVRPGLANPTSHFVVAPNRDTVYALAVLDLRAGPHALTVPAIPDRYHVIQFLDAWMGNFALVGTRTTGGRGGTWVITPPGSHVAIPRGAHRLAAPTNQVILLGRIRAVDDADAVVASAAFRAMTLAPVDPDAPPAPSMAAPAGTPQSVGANGVAFFDEVGDALVANPPATAAQRRAMEAAAALGIGAGLHPSADPNAQTSALASGVSSGLAAIEDPKVRSSRTINGWAVNLDLGKKATGAGLLPRAVVAKYYWGPVPAKEAVYPRALTAADGLPLDGAKRYRIHFPAGKTPPVDAFWSVTVYGPDMFLVPNAADRYSISGDTPGLTRDADGSLDLFLQQQPPPVGTANWLPVPAGPFNLVMRCYLPRPPILDGSYEYPPITVTA